MNKQIIVIGIVIFAFVIGFVYWQGTGSRQALVSEESVKETSSSDDSLSGFLIRGSDEGFSPGEMTIPAGAYVSFKNEGSRPFWPASAVHPTHTVYPNSDIRKCGTPEAAGMFDACAPVSPGEAWTFRFIHTGSWNYHDHLNPNHRGTIIVK